MADAAENPMGRLRAGSGEVLDAVDLAEELDFDDEAGGQPSQVVINWGPLFWYGDISNPMKPICFRPPHNSTYNWFLGPPGVEVMFFLVMEMLGWDVSVFFGWAIFFECIDSELDGLGMTLGVAFFLGDMTQRRNSMKTKKKDDIREKCLKLIPVYSNLWT